MKGHLTEDQLVKYQFKLASERQLAKDEAHLKQCAQCGNRLEELKRKFAVLDVMQGDLHASEELISQTLAGIENTPPVRILSFGRRTWLGAAAAVILIGLGLLFGPSLSRPPASKPVVTVPRRRMRLQPC